MKESLTIGRKLDKKESIVKKFDILEGNFVVERGDENKKLKDILLKKEIDAMKKERVVERKLKIFEKPEEQERLEVRKKEKKERILKLKRTPMKTPLRSMKKEKILLDLKERSFSKSLK